MSSRSRLSARTGGKRGDFRKRYDIAERQRAVLLGRLRRLGEKGCAFPTYKTALILLNEKFRRADLDQRLAIIKAANWSIRLIEMNLEKS